MFQLTVKQYNVILIICPDNVFKSLWCHLLMIRTSIFDAKV